MNILIVANCHGKWYENALRSTGLFDQHNIESMLNYKFLKNFNLVKNKLSRCDVLVIQPIYKYEEFKIENIKSFLKPECHVIRTPFVRFHGFWHPNDIRTFNYIGKAAVAFFPKVYFEKEVSPYLDGLNLDKDAILYNFDECLKNLKKTEKDGDIKFCEFFKDNYQNVPLFKDKYHMTAPFFRYITKQINKMVEQAVYPLNKETNQTVPGKTIIGNNIKKEYGHFKPITNRYAEVLGLKYNLDSFFLYSRFDYLTGIIRIENEGKRYFNSLSELKTYFDEEYVR